MRAGGSKQKGNGFEIKVAKELSLWLTEGVRSDVLERSPSSGAKATALAKSGQLHGAIAGDIISVAEEGHYLTDKFIIECKHYKNINVEGLIFKTSNNAGISFFWNKVCKESAQYNKNPMLIARQNNRPVLMCLNLEGVKLFNIKELIIGSFSMDHHNMHILYYTEFLTKAKPL